MIKRYGLFVTHDSTVTMICHPGFGAPLFEVEGEATQYIKRSFGENDLILILPVWVGKNVAEKQTIRMH